MATLTGTSGNDTLTGTSSADTLVGSGGDDFYDGGGGTDTLDLRATSTATIVDFTDGTISGGFTGSFTNIERVLAGNGNDHLIGGAGAQNLSGRAGSDTLEGGAGNDWLWGGGGGLENQYVFRETGTANADQIGDFISGADKIVLDGSVMAALGAEGNFAAGDARFAANTSGTAQDASDRVIYETDTRQIWYDPDGNGAAARQLIATLQSGATLTATDIVVEGAGTPPPGGADGTEGDDTLVGTPGDDTINGLGGNDSITGLEGDDSLSGDAGNDTLDGGPGTDTLDGGVGDDTYVNPSGDVVTDAGGIDTVIGFETSPVLPDGIENLILRGGPFPLGNDDFTSSGDGNDLDNIILNERSDPTGLYGRGGDDTLIGSTGTDYFLYRGSTDSGHDFVDGGGGFNILQFLQTNPVTIDFREGTATSAFAEVSFQDIQEARGGLGDDLLIANDAGILLWGIDGDDTLIGGSGDDLLFADDSFTGFGNGASGNDSLTGGAGDDRLVGGSGNDFMDGGSGNDRLEAGGDLGIGGEPDAGNDTLRGGSGNDTLQGGGGADRLIFDQAPGAANADHVVGFASGEDEIHLDATVMSGLGTSGAFPASDARFYAAAGASAGHDTDDRVVYDTSSGNLWYDADGSGAQAAQLVAILDGAASLAATDIVVDNGGSTSGDQHLVGTPGDDNLAGGSGNDTIEGLGGLDTLNGAGGNDLLAGGSGWDTLTGGAGQDTFAFAEFGSGMNDAITDFVSGTDTLQLDAAAFTAIGASGRFTAGDGRFFAAPGVSAGHDADDRLIYDTTSGILYYDADGNGSGGEARVAILEGAPALAATDIVVEGAPTSGGEHIVGTSGDDTLSGTAGDDFIEALDGDDTISVIPAEGYGSDTVDGGNGSDRLDFGTAGAPPVSVDFGAGTGSGSAGSVVFSGIEGVVTTAGDDTVIADDSGVAAVLGQGNDVFVGGTGDDQVNDGEVEAGTGDGADQISGGAGNDSIVIAGGDDMVDAGAGDDEIVILAAMRGYGNDTIDGGDGVDEIRIVNTASFTINLQSGTLVGGGEGGGSASLSNIENVTVTAGIGFDLDITGSDVANELFAGGGSDTVLGLAGDDIIHAEGGSDTITGGAGNDVLESGSGSHRFVFDQAPGAADADLIRFFASGSDQLHLSLDSMSALGTSGQFAAGDDRFHAAPGAAGGADAEDRVIYDTTSGEVFYDADGSGSGSAQLIATLEGSPSLAATDIVVLGDAPPPPPPPGNTVNGTSGSDTLSGTTGNDTLNGLGGNDTLIGSGGTDFYDGGSGSDTLDLRATPTATAVSFAAGTISGGFSGTFANIERVLAGNGADSLSGGSGAQNLSGRAGNDTVEGGAGNDWLWGGGSEVDTFVFREAGSGNADDVGDFTGGVDRIALDNATLAALGADGAFTGGDARFFGAAGASAGHDTDDRVVYNTSTGQLYYDDDGSGAHAAQLIATLHGAPTLAAAEISVI